MAQPLQNVSIAPVIPVFDQNSSEYAAIMVAIKYDHKRTAKIILNNPSSMIISKLQEILVAVVITRPGWTDVIDQLFKVGAKPEMQNVNGDTILHVAFNNPTSYSIVDSLLKRYLSRSYLNLANFKGISILHIACTRPDMDVIGQLLDANPPDAIHTKEESELTPLHYAVMCDRLEVTNFLIQRGADIYEVDGNRSTPLHWALYRRSVPIIDLLLSMDSRKTNLTNVHGLSHFMAACAGSDETVVEYFLLNGRSKDLVKNKVFNCDYFTDYTPLHFAVQLGRYKTVELLLHEKANCCASAYNNLTPHALAEFRGNKRIRELLQKHCLEKKGLKMIS
ncbi:ankyrin-3-like [Phymastichus coffea]|uniref:ankyrin-3-like n=1 Tax=Phymastichus coffea TaxID=108790 RepID=UPI00273CAE38|nr:ankyrin-3-like [Phymastichus coffea]